MKVLLVMPCGVSKEVPPLTLQVTFENEDEMRRYRSSYSPLHSGDVHFLMYQRLGDHLEAHTGRRN